MNFHLGRQFCPHLSWPIGPHRPWLVKPGSGIWCSSIAPHYLAGLHKVPAEIPALVLASCRFPTFGCPERGRPEHCCWNLTPGNCPGARIPCCLLSSQHGVSELRLNCTGSPLNDVFLAFSAGMCWNVAQCCRLSCCDDFMPPAFAASVTPRRTFLSRCW